MHSQLFDRRHGASPSPLTKGKTTPETNNEKHLKQNNLNSNNVVDSFNNRFIENHAMENAHIEENGIKIKGFLSKPRKEMLSRPNFTTFTYKTTTKQTTTTSAKTATITTLKSTKTTANSLEENRVKEIPEVSPYSMKMTF